MNLEQLCQSIGLETHLNQGAASCVSSPGCHGVSQSHLEALIAEMLRMGRLPSVLFNGHEVYMAIPLSAREKISADSVADVLDAVVKLIRALPDTDLKGE